MVSFFVNPPWDANTSLKSLELNIGQHFYFKSLLKGLTFIKMNSSIAFFRHLHKIYLLYK